MLFSETEKSLMGVQVRNSGFSPQISTIMDMSQGPRLGKEVNQIQQKGTSKMIYTEQERSNTCNSSIDERYSKNRDMKME